MLTQTSCTAVQVSNGCKQRMRASSATASLLGLQQDALLLVRGLRELLARAAAGEVQALAKLVLEPLEEQVGGAAGAAAGYQAIVVSSGRMVPLEKPVVCTVVSTAKLVSTLPWICLTSCRCCYCPPGGPLQPDGGQPRQR